MSKDKQPTPKQSQAFVTVTGILKTRTKTSLSASKSQSCAMGRQHHLFNKTRKYQSRQLVETDTMTGSVGIQGTLTTAEFVSLRRDQSCCKSRDFMGSLTHHTSSDSQSCVLGEHAKISPARAEQYKRTLNAEHPNQRYKRGTTRRETQTPWLMFLSFQICLFQSFFVVAQLSGAPSISSVPSPMPYTEPSLLPSTFPSTFQPSNVPSSGVPTFAPSTNPPSMSPSHDPTTRGTYFITKNPSTDPSNVPSFTFSPSGTVVTRQPTSSPKPSKHPTITSVPTTVPTTHPSAFPSYFMRITSSAVFNQKFQVANSVDFMSQRDVFEEVMEGYTTDLAAEVGVDLEAFPTLITSFCVAIMALPTDSNATQSTSGRKLRKKQSRFRNLDESADSGIEFAILVEVQYSMTYRSRNINITSFPDRFQSVIANNLGNVTQDMQAAGLNVTEALNITRVESTAITSAPSSSQTLDPSHMPSVGVPSVAPSGNPSGDSSLTSSESHAPSPEPSQPTGVMETSSSPSSYPTGSTPSPSGGTNSVVIAIVAAVGVTAVCLLLICFYRWRKREAKPEIVAAYGAGGARLADSHSPIDTNSQNNTEANTSVSPNQPESTAADETKDLDGSVKSESHEVLTSAPPRHMLSPTLSLLSSGNSLIGDSFIFAAEGDRHYSDKFDRYKDHNLEKMRSGVEETVMEVDGMMSQAVTRALLDDDDNEVNREILYWGSQGDPTEIEATALSEVNDWLKRKKGACVDERYVHQLVFGGD
jgi:hypothetical protein